MSLSACDCVPRCHSPKGSPLTVVTRSPSTRPQEACSVVCPAAVNFSQRMSVPFRSLFGRGARLCLPGASDRAMETEVFTQRLAGVILVIEPAALQFRNHMVDEIGVGARHIGRGDDEAVAAAAGEHLFQLVGDLLRAADNGVLGLAAAGEGDEIAC